MGVYYDPDEAHPYMGIKHTLSDGEVDWYCKWCNEYEDAWQHEHDDDPVPPGREIIATCSECGFSSSDIPLVQNHNCDIERNGGRCEDYPACGHEWGDCNGKKYGSTQSILALQEKLQSRGYSDYEIDDIFERMQ